MIKWKTHYKILLYLFVVTLVVIICLILNTFFVINRTFSGSDDILNLLNFIFSIALLPLFVFFFLSRDKFVRKNIELHRLRSKLSHVTESNYIMTLQYNVSKKQIIFWNDMEGKPLETYSTDTFQSRIYPDDLPIAQKYISRMDNNETEKYLFEFRFRLPDSEQYTWLSISTFPYEKDKEGKVISYMSIAVNTNNRHKMYDNLDLYRKRISFVSKLANIGLSLYDVTNDSFYVLDSAGEHPDYYINFEDLNRFIYHKDINMVHDVIDRMKAHKEEIIHYDFRRSSIKNSNHFFWYHGDAIAYGHDKNGEISSYLILNINTETWHETMNEMNQLSRKAELLKMIAGSLENIGRKVRTPLNAVMGFSDVITEEESEEARKQYRKIIEENSAMLLKMSEDILTLSKIESDNLDLNRSHIDIFLFLGEWWLQYQKTLRPNIHFDYGSGEDRFIVKIDSDLVKKLLTTIANYLVSYTKKGDITIKYSIINENDLYITVSDPSFYLDKSEQKYIFEHFDNHDHSSKYISGLGLPVCKTFFSQNDGDIGVTSSPENGTTFWFWLPNRLIKYSQKQ
jgi:signal transduction histidine kinase